MKNNESFTSVLSLSDQNQIVLRLPFLGLIPYWHIIVCVNVYVGLYTLCKSHYNSGNNSLVTAVILMHCITIGLSIICVVTIFNKTKAKSNKYI